MKRIIITLSTIVVFSATASAQFWTKKNGKKSKQKVETTQEIAKPIVAPPPPQVGNAMPQIAVPQAEVYDFDKYAKVDKVEHNFGDNVKQLQEGVSCTFTITNISNEPLTIEHVQASCGCTVPSWDKEPIAPGKKGKFTANYHSQGRPGPISKSLTITTSRGKKVVTIKGNVEPNPVTPPPPAPAQQNAPIYNGGH